MSQLPQANYDTDRVLTLPNVLSFLRLCAVGLFGWLILAEHDWAAVGVLVASGITDWFDGFLARRLKQTSALGAKLDPIADRLYILTAISTLAVRGIVPWWLLLLLAARDLMLLGLMPSLRRSGVVALPVNSVGKAATMALLVSFPLVLVASARSLQLSWAGWIGWPLAVIGLIFYWWAGGLYLWRTIELARKRLKEG